MRFARGLTRTRNSGATPPVENSCNCAPPREEESACAFERALLVDADLFMGVN
ncbi:MAG: hypothetical protein ACREVN_02855 [Gammaproteobacteria bacterium]